MADFTPKPIQYDENSGRWELNDGKEYINGVDIPDADDWNKVIESQLWAQKLAENPVDNSEANQVGEAEITIAYKADGTPYFKAKNLKGQDGEQGEQGEQGETGVGVSSAITKYATSGSGTTPPSSGWTTIIPSVTAGEYLWTRTVTTYTDNTTNTAYSVARQGLNGYNGLDGSSVSISSQTVQYCVSTSGITIPITGWDYNIPSIPQGQYLWTRTNTTYSTGDFIVSYSKAYQGKDGINGTNGTNGKDGATITGSFVSYKASSSGTNPPSSGWTVNVPTVEKGQYLWSKNVVQYSDGTSTTTYNVAYQGMDGTTPDMSKYVTTDTDQEITGNKLFLLNENGYLQIQNNDGMIVFYIGDNSGQPIIEIDSDGLNNVPICLMGDCGTDGQVLTSHGEGSTPSWETPNFATQEDVDNAIASAITTALNTPV